MIKVHYDELEALPDELDETKFVKETFKNPCCNIDVTYTWKICGSCVQINLRYEVQIKDGETNVLRYCAPYLLRYSKDKYDEYGLKTIAESAGNETQKDAMSRLMFPIMAYFQTKISFLNVSMN
ncbi:MAG: hypothetical protein HFF02_05090 [Erysipelotrichaceae bacterium]|nr:hypothetical protein [Erysipelotrichaceae bacterium]